MSDPTIGFLGAGQMARALAKGFVQAGLAKGATIVATDPVPAAGQQFVQEVPGSSLHANGAAVTQAADVLFLAVKPQNFPVLCAEVAGKLQGKLTVSILAGVPLAKL